MTILDHIPVTIDADEVMHQARLSGQGEELEQNVRELVDAACRSVNPKAVYRVCYVENKSEDTVQISDIGFASRVLATNLADVERVFPYVATCGTELDAMAVGGGDMLLRYCADLIKQTALGAALTYLREHLKSTYALGRTAIMNPGSLEDWPITQQQELFSLLGDVAGLIGVRLTESLLMVPTKSVSGIIFPTEVSFESCQLCPREACPGRRASYDPHRAQQYGILAEADIPAPADTAAADK